MIWEAIEAIASVVTAAGVFIGAFQLLLTKRIDQTRFEDDLVNHYREIIRLIPVEALIGRDLTSEEIEKAREGVYFYIDLCNDQVFLRQNGRISRATWTLWRDGMKSNLSRPAFKKVWEEIKNASPRDFSELKQLEKTEFKDDPKSW